METNLVVESLKFMVLGMGIVFILLALIVFLTNLQAKLVGKYFPDKPKEAVGGKSNAAASANSNDGAVVAAIVAAVTEYKKG
jgi:oxaloacetate decarboxylase gamma subunit